MISNVKKKMEIFICGTKHHSAFRPMCVTAGLAAIAVISIFHEVGGTNFSLMHSSEYFGFYTQYLKNVVQCIVA